MTLVGVRSARNNAGLKRLLGHCTGSIDLEYDDSEEVEDTGLKNTNNKVLFI